MAYRTPRHYIPQGIYITGLLTLMAYFVYFELWPVFYPMAFELSCIFYLTYLKIYYEVLSPKAPTTDTADLELNDIDRVGGSASVQEGGLKPSLSLKSGNGGTAVGSDAGKVGEDISVEDRAGGGEGADARAGAEQA